MEARKLIDFGKPVYLNSDGRGVAWLHIRLDNKPKYYKSSYSEEIVKIEILKKSDETLKQNRFSKVPAKAETSKAHVKLETPKLESCLEDLFDSKVRRLIEVSKALAGNQQSSSFDSIFPRENQALAEILKLESEIKKIRQNIYSELNK